MVGKTGYDFAITLTILAVLLLLVPGGTSAQSVRRRPDLPKFIGHEVTILEPERDEDSFPKGPASICVEGLPQRQCYKAPETFGNNPKVALIQLDKDTPALFFSAESVGVSGWGIHFALLRPGTGAYLEDLFASSTSVSNQSRYAFWYDLTTSDAPIFVTAEYVWGPDEGHYSAHRYIISAYVRRPASMVYEGDERYYYLEDRYMTAHKYDLDAKADILSSEKREIVARLRRLKAETELQQQAPR